MSLQLASTIEATKDSRDRSWSSSGLEMDDGMDICGPSAASSPRPNTPTQKTSKGGRGKVKWSRTAPDTDDQPQTQSHPSTTLEVLQEKSKQLLGCTSNILEGEHPITTSEPAAWGNIIATLTARIDKALLPQFYKESLDRILVFIDRSQSLHAVPIQPHLQSQQFGQLQHQQEQQQQTFPMQQQQPPPTHAPMWTTMVPVPGQPNAGNAVEIPRRPASTPNPNPSPGLSTLFGPELAAELQASGTGNQGRGQFQNWN